MKLTESDIENYAKTWGIRVNVIVAKRFLNLLDTDSLSYMEALTEIHSWGASQETKIAMEYILLKLYNPKPVYKGKCGSMPGRPSAVDRFLKIQKGELIL